MPIEVSAPEPRPMLVVVLADTSGSMGVDGKITVLNDAVSRMVDAFKQLHVPGCEIVLSVVAFGGSASVHLAPTAVREVQWSPLGAAGGTPMGAAFDLASRLLADESVVPPRSFRPNLVLVSDGIPTDEWESPLRALDAIEHAKRALRFAVGIGADARGEVLKRFAGDVGEVVPVERVELLTEFFRYVTYTVTRAAQRPVRSQAELPTFKNYPSNDVVEF